MTKHINDIMKQAIDFEPEEDTSMNTTQYTGLQSDYSNDDNMTEQLPEDVATSMALEVIHAEVPEYAQHFVQMAKTPEERAELIANLTSYTGAETQRIDAYLGKTVEVVGMILHHVNRSEYVDPQTGEVKVVGPYDHLLIKLTKLIDHEDPDRGPVVIDCGARQLMETAQLTILPMLGWGDWQVGPRFVHFSKVGQTYRMRLLTAKEQESKRKELGSKSK